MNGRLHRIDVHHHIVAPEYVGALAGLGIAGGGGIAFPAWSAGATLEMMDRQGIAAAVTSVSSPGVHFGEAAFARDLARRCNETSAADEAALRLIERENAPALLPSLRARVA